MFDSIGWGEILVLIIAGLFILGPERLPSAAAWLGKTIRQVKEYTTGAREQLRNELGPEFDELRKPLEELRGIRDLDPRKMITRQLFDDGPADLVKRNGFFTTPDDPAPSPAPPAPPSIVPEHPAIRSFRSLLPGERPPVDPDAT